MTTSEAKAPPKTVIRGCREAMIAAMRNVLSPAHVSKGLERACFAVWHEAAAYAPISETTIITNAWKKASGCQPDPGA